MGLKLKRRPFHWSKIWKLIFTRDPRMKIFELIAPADDEKVLTELADATSPRPAFQEGHASLKSPGGIFVAATLAYPARTRFSDGSYGVYYAGRSLRTAVREGVYHVERFMKKTREKPTTTDMLTIVSRLDGDLHDARTLPDGHAVYHPKSYADSQVLGKDLRRAGSNGIVYHSVRDRGGECVAAFNGRVLSHCRRDRYFVLHWNGKAIDRVEVKQEFVRFRPTGKF